ncbi:MAG: glycogen debranching N-terminal domain-containing protein [Actinomyces sp.]|uniref:glycogen debranching N-terminal domain-containing protein n=1 Tax=Actinomyces sp. TaxID=29317 RepID=UPI0026DB8E8F|nr:glycogen debranching N-terminal domain-containing protein [Actinomyces sp.]MDO4242756.1 glycogen debranching N-terminal domain-containing protein [Actinomyces sp.]
MRHLQPLLHEQVVLVSAPAQVLSNADGSLGSHAVEGVYHSDIRLLRHRTCTLSGSGIEHLATTGLTASSCRHLAVARDLDRDGADPRTTLTTEREVTASAEGAVLTETLIVQAAWPAPVHTVLTVELASDLSGMDTVKAGRSVEDLAWIVEEDGARVERGAARALVSAPGARLNAEGTVLRLSWQVTAEAGRPFTATWTLTGTDEDAVVQAAAGLPQRVRPTPADPAAAAWSATALDDLDHLLLARRPSPDRPFAAAGAPWFLTLFGRDCLWTARMLLHEGDPWSLALAEGTLRTLADLQGRRHDPECAEQPGKIMHELRRATNDVDGTVVLPPLYYGTIDATALWVLTLDDAHRAGLPPEVVHDLLPALRAALTWLTEHADSDSDGFIEYIDTTGHGLANQGWKDSGDSIQHADGSLARGPIALVEVQGYGYAAALAGARLLRALGQGRADTERAAALEAWAAGLKERFTDAFWCGDAATGHPVIALDADKRQVDSLTSNIGHLLGTGIIDAQRARRVAELLVSPELFSGYGLRTLATTMGGYWPLSYHGGSVWTHDTAIAIDGLLREGLTDQAGTLARGLLAAAPAFGYRMPELFSGASADDGAPVPYPASCRPQAWAAAASAVVARAV